MKETNYTMVAIYVVVGLLVGGFAGYSLAPPETITEKIQVEVNPLQGQTVQIGYVTSQASNLEYVVPNVQDIIMEDINDYAARMNYDVDFEWLIDSADSQAAIHLEKVQGFKAMDVNIFMGGAWSSQASGALSYVNENDMLMISSSSTSPLLAIPDDRLFRTCPTDRVQGPAIGEMLETWGIEAVLIVMRADAWGDGIWNILSGELNNRGIVVIEQVRYAGESMEFSSYLETMDNLLEDAIATYGADKVAVQTMSFDEIVVLLTQSTDYPNTREIIWFGTETSGRNNRVVDDAVGTQIDVRVFSSLMTPGKTWKWTKYSERFNALTGRVAGFYDASDYDAMWIQALSIMEAGSFAAADVALVFPVAASNFWGTSGWVDLDENDDRKAQIFDIWGYTDDGAFQSWGSYNGRDVEVTWYDDLLAESGLVRPSTQ